MQSSAAVKKSSIRVAAAERGHRLHSLALVYSYKNQVTLIVPSIPALFHVVMLETDRNVASYVLEQPTYAAMIDGERVWTRFDATVRQKVGGTTWDEVKGDVAKEALLQTPQIQAQISIAAEHGEQYRLFTLADFRDHQNRIWNGIRMLSTVQRARTLTLATARTAIVARLLHRPATQGELRQFADGDEGLNLAALYGLYLDGRVDADLAAGPVTDLTEFRLQQERSDA